MTALTRISLRRRSGDVKENNSLVLFLLRDYYFSRRARLPTCIATYSSPSTTASRGDNDNLSIWGDNYSATATSSTATATARGHSGSPAAPSAPGNSSSSTSAPIRSCGPITAP